MGKRMRIIVLACVTLVVAVSLIALATFALWSSDVTVSNHLQAGKLSATLYRTSYTKNELNEEGMLVSSGPITDRVDLTGENPANVFGITDDSPAMVPGAYYEATLELGNGGDVAFCWWAEIVLKDAQASEFAKQLKVSVRIGNDDPTEQMLSTGTSLGSESAPLGTVNNAAAVNFTVKVEFTSDDDNNSAMNQSAVFDIVIHAVQVSA